MEEIKLSIITYLKDGITKMSLEQILKITKYVNDSFTCFEKKDLDELKANYEKRLASGDYEGGAEMPGINNNWNGYGPLYIATNLFYDTTTHNVYINKNFPEKRIDAMIVLACEVFKKLCSDANEEDETWFIERLTHVISSFIGK
jgi:hypothetical protein